MDKLSATLILGFSVLVLLVSIYLLVRIWPSSTQELSSNATRIISFYVVGPVAIGPETLVLYTVMLSAVIGGCVYSLYETAASEGWKDFHREWTAWYLLRPFIAAGLGLIVYFLVRGGLLTASAGLSSMNLSGMAGLAGLVGLFAEQFMKKLKDVADELFTSKPAT